MVGDLNYRFLLHFQNVLCGWVLFIDFFIQYLSNYLCPARIQASNKYHMLSLIFYRLIFYSTFIRIQSGIKSQIYKQKSMGNCGNESAVNASTPNVRNVQSQNYVPPPPLASTTPLQDGDQFDVIVIGGGIGGVAAAVELAKSGRRVAVLQANNYLGGRLRSLNVNLKAGGNLAFDQGASWIHGSCQQHPITKLSKNIPGLAMKETDDDSLQVFEQNGQDAQKPSQQGFQTYQKIVQKCSEYDHSTSLWDAMAQQQQQVLNDKYVMYNVANDVEFQTSASIHQLSAQGQDDDQYDGTQMLILSGYQRFVQTLSTFAKFSIYLNSKIIRISHQQQTNKVTLSNGISVYARSIVINAPIGVLKSHGIQFYPQLPGWKEEAIQSIGFGNVCKILLDFSNGNFLQSQSHYIGVVSQDIQKRGLGTYFINLKAIAGIPALMTFGLGGNADQAQKMPEQQLKQFLAKRIAAFAKQQVTPNDFRLYRTSWRTNPNFQGAYAFGATTTQAQHWQNMAKPVFDYGWYFCGEHTTSKYRGTVHGAYLSGVFAAKCIDNKMTEEDWAYPDYEEGSNQQKKQKKRKGSDDSR